MLHPSKEELHPSKEKLHPSKEELHPSKEELHPSEEELYPSKEELSPSKEELHPGREGVHHPKGIGLPSQDAALPRHAAVGPRLLCFFLMNGIVISKAVTGGCPEATFVSLLLSVALPMSFLYKKSGCAA
ncbi:MAG TPA: hypothetical protein VJ550_01920 [Geomonas sp.]|nr:hypothetical protein [Geomonas sp.]